MYIFLGVHLLFEIKVKYISHKYSITFNQKHLQFLFFFVLPACFIWKQKKRLDRICSTSFQNAASEGNTNENFLLSYCCEYFQQKTLRHTRLCCPSDQFFCSASFRNVSIGWRRGWRGWSTAGWWQRRKPDKQTKKLRDYQKINIWISSHIWLSLNVED